MMGYLSMEWVLWRLLITQMKHCCSNEVPSLASDTRIRKELNQRSHENGISVAVMVKVAFQCMSMSSVSGRGAKITYALQSKPKQNIK